MAATDRGSFFLYVYTESFKIILKTADWIKSKVIYGFLGDPLNRLWNILLSVKKRGRHGGGLFTFNGKLKIHSNCLAVAQMYLMTDRQH